MPPVLENQPWLKTFQELLHHYLPPLESSPFLNVGSLVAVGVGLYLVFRAAKSERTVVCVFAAFLGGWLGYRFSLYADTPGPISIAIAAVIVTAIAFKTYKWWLAAGSVVVLFMLATLFQLGRGDLQRYLPTSGEGTAVRSERPITLPTAEEQRSNLYPQAAEQLLKMKDKVVEELRAMGLQGWLLPAAAAILGGILAFWALRVFSVVWLGMLGSALAVLGTCTFASAHWPKLRDSFMSRPDVVFYTIVGLWLLGLILQAKDARFPKKRLAAEKPAAAKPA